MWKKIIAISGAALTIASLVGVCFVVENHFAEAAALQEEVKERLLLAERLDNKIIMDKINYWETKIDRIEEKYEGKVMPADAKGRIKDALREIKELEKKLKGEG